MLTDADKKRLKRAWLGAYIEKQRIEASLGAWRKSKQGAVARDLAPILKRFCGHSLVGLSWPEFYEERIPNDTTGAEAVVAMMLSAAIERIGANATGRIFSALTSRSEFDLVELMRDLGRAYSVAEVRRASGKARQVGERPTQSARWVYVLTEVSVLGQINPRTYSYHPSIKRTDVFKIMDKKKWFSDRWNAPFKAPKATLAAYHARTRKRIAACPSEAYCVANLISFQLSWLSHNPGCVPPDRQKWPRRHPSADE